MIRIMDPLLWAAICRPLLGTHSCQSLSSGSVSDGKQQLVTIAPGK
jgi:hypothetical protein